MRAKRKTINETKGIIKEKGGTLLNIESKNGNTQLTIRCKNDHTWTAKFGAINRGQWCWECYKLGKVKPVDHSAVLKEIASRGFELLTPAPIEFWSAIEVYCPKHEHKWTTSYAQFDKNNTNCIYCGSGTQGWDIINPTLEELGFEFVERIRGDKTVRNIKLRCIKHNHEWLTHFGAILKKDRICYYCAWENRKTSYEVIKNRVEGLGGTLLTENCCGSLTPIKIKCENGHEWDTYFDNINSKKAWCPVCRRKAQRELYQILQEIFPGQEAKFNYKGFSWLKTNKRNKQRMEIDIWLPEIKLAIEYDGIQHFQPVKYTKKTTDAQAKRAFELLQQRDSRKTALIQKHTDDIKYFIRFSYKEAIDKDYILEKLHEFKVPV